MMRPGNTRRRAPASLSVPTPSAPRTTVTDPVNDLLAASVTAMRAGDAARAHTLLTRACALGPDRADAAFLTGLAAQALARTDEALAAFTRALTLAPRGAHAADAALHLGALRMETGDHAGAEAALAHALALSPGAPEDAAVWTALAGARLELGRVDAAEAALWEALSLRLDASGEKAAAWLRIIDTEPIDRLCNSPPPPTPTARLLDHPKDALAEPAPAPPPARLSAPELPEILDGLGHVALARGRFAEAVSRYAQGLALAAAQDAVTRTPRVDLRASLWSNLGVALKNEGRIRAALAAFASAVALSASPPPAPAPSPPLVPVLVDALCNMANAWQLHGAMDEARHCFEHALTLHPDSMPALWGATFAHIPIIYTTHDEIPRARAAYAAALGRLETKLQAATPAQRREAGACVGRNQPFYLAYQGINERSLQATYGRIVHGCMAARRPEHAKPIRHRYIETRRLRVGVVTAFMREHSVWKLPTMGWVEGLDRDRFELFGYHTDVREDHCTRDAARLFETLRREPHDVDAMCKAIAGDQLDALLFPEVGMDPMTAQLAGLRFAPVQAVSLGHPMTTGLPTMDYFLSSALMEPDAPELSDHWYTERLVRLPGLGTMYAPLPREIPPLSRADFGMEDDAVLAFCPQTLFKLLPQYDMLFPSIAACAPQTRFVFLGNNLGEAITNDFAHRLHDAFRRHGLDADRHVRLLPYQPSDRYLALTHCCDFFLDSVGWSGFNTAMEAAAAGLPLITCPTGPMRGRHASAVAQMLGLDAADTGRPAAMASSLEDYIALAATVANDATVRAAMRRHIERNRDRLFGQAAGAPAIHGLTQFLLTTAAAR